MSNLDSKLARANRRHHRHRLWCNRRFHWGRDLAGADENSKSRGKAVDTPTPCSCWMCGNPRRHFGKKTLQELRQDKADGKRIREPYFS